MCVCVCVDCWIDVWTDRSVTGLSDVWWMDLWLGFVYGRMYRWMAEWMEKVCTSVSNVTRCRSEFVTLDPKLVRTLDGMLFY